MVSLGVRLRRGRTSAVAALAFALVTGAASAGVGADDAIVLGTRAGIVSIDPTGRGAKVIYPRRSAHDPSWSPDHSAVAVVETPLKVVGLDGSARELPMRGEQLNPSWSPDGRRIAFSMIDDDRCYRLRLRHCRLEIYVVNADGTGLRRITDGGDAALGHLAPTWSPDGRRIAYSAAESGGRGMPVRLRKESRIMVVGANGGTPRPILKLPFPYHAEDLDWSRTNGTIVFSYIEGSGLYRGLPVVAAKLAVVKPDGTGFHDLTSFAIGKADDPAWSPDGKRVAFIGHLAGDPLYAWSAYVLAPGGQPRKLIGAESLDW